MSDLGFARSIYSNDKRDACIPVFHMAPTKVVDESGVTTFEERAFVRIIAPGNDREVVDRPVRDEDKARWPEHWSAFLQKREPPVSGTPLSVWPGVTATEVSILRDKSVKTVEQLAELPEHDLRNYPSNILRLKQQARAFLENQVGHAAMTRLETENDKLMARVAALEKALAEADEPPTGKTKKSKKVKNESADDLPSGPG